MMAKAGCLADPSTSTYCYIDSVYSRDPSDLYFYQLPLGTKLPPSTKATCSGCTRSLLSLYHAALENAHTAGRGGGTTGGDADIDAEGAVAGLKVTYDAAAALAVRDCGPEYAPLSSSGVGRRGGAAWVWVWAGMVGLWMMRCW
jgi:hypothetical protein